jgi:hypothetical protein
MYAVTVFGAVAGGVIPAGHLPSPSPGESGQFTDHVLRYSVMPIPV